MTEFDATNPVTLWIQEFKRGDAESASSKQEAARRLFDFYHQEIVARARKKLSGSPRRSHDAEDVALSAFESFFVNINDGPEAFPRLVDRNDVHQILLMLVHRKAMDHIRRECANKRGGGNAARGPGDKEVLGGESLDVSGFAPVDAAPTPAMLAEVGEETERLLSLLGSEELREIALHRLDGYTNPEIAERFRISKRRVERSLALIRDLWAGELDR